MLSNSLLPLRLNALFLMHNICRRVVSCVDSAQGILVSSFVIYSALFTDPNSATVTNMPQDLTLRPITINF